MTASTKELRMISLLLLIRFFPFDPSIDVPLTRIHLPLIYLLTWGLHLVYVSYIVGKWRALRKSTSQIKGHR
jgi:hypothetical protein